MPPKEWTIRLEHMLEAAERVTSYTGGMDFEEFTANRMAVSAVMHEIQTIGEAARHVPSDIEARSIGASAYRPAVAAGRTFDKTPLFGIPSIRAFPFRGSAIVYWDAGPTRVATPPLVNQPNRAQEEPHEYPRRTPEARQQKSDFLQLNGAVTNPCGDAPCVAAPDVG